MPMGGVWWPAAACMWYSAAGAHPTQDDYTHPPHSGRGELWTCLSVVDVDSHTCRCLWLVYLQIDWLNAYHAECLDKIGGYLADQGKTEALQWLQRETKPVGWSILELWYSPSIQFLIIGTGWTLYFKLWMMLYTQLNASSTLQRVRRDIILCDHRFQTAHDIISMVCRIWGRTKLR